MKHPIPYCLIAGLTLVSSAFAGGPNPGPTPPEIPQSIGRELEAAILNGWLNTTVEGIWAPTLAKHVGAEIKFWHPVPVTDALDTGIGVSLMAINGNYYSGSFGATLKKTFTIPGLEKFPITPRAEAGAYVPFKTAEGTSQGSSADLGAYTEGGAMIQLWHNDAKTFVFEVGGSYKRIFATGGGFNTFNGLAQIGIKF